VHCLGAPCCVRCTAWIAPRRVCWPSILNAPAQPSCKAQLAWIRSVVSGWCASGGRRPRSRTWPICSNGSAFPLPGRRPDWQGSFGKGPFGPELPGGDDKLRSTGGAVFSRRVPAALMDRPRPFLPCCRCGQRQIARLWQKSLAASAAAVQGNWDPHQAPERPVRGSLFSPRERPGMGPESCCLAAPLHRWPSPPEPAVSGAGRSRLQNGAAL